MLPGRRSTGKGHGRRGKWIRGLLEGHHQARGGVRLLPPIEVVRSDVTLDGLNRLELLRILRIKSSESLGVLRHVEVIPLPVADERIRRGRWLHHARRHRLRSRGNLHLPFDDGFLLRADRAVDGQIIISVRTEAAGLHDFQEPTRVHQPQSAEFARHVQLRFHVLQEGGPQLDRKSVV